MRLKSVEIPTKNVYTFWTMNVFQDCRGSLELKLGAMVSSARLQSLLTTQKVMRVGVDFGCSSLCKK